MYLTNGGSDPDNQRPDKLSSTVFLCEISFFWGGGRKMVDTTFKAGDYKRNLYNEKKLPLEYFFSLTICHKQSSRTHTYKHLVYLVLYYKRRKPPACTCSGHPYDHPQGRVIQRMYYENFKNQCTNVKY